jgi:hypothetical protein
VIKMCEYAAQGNVERIRLLAINGVDVSLGDYDLRTPLHLAACNGNTAVLEYLLQQDSVIVNAVDRFGGTPHQGVKDCFCTYLLIYCGAAFGFKTLSSLSSFRCTSTREKGSSSDARRSKWRSCRYNWFS